MNTLTYTQEYFLCAVGSKGIIPAVTGGEASTCLVVSGITELLGEGYVTLNEKEKLIGGKEWNNDLPHVRPLYEKIISLKRPLAIADFVVGIYNPKQINELICTVGTTSVEAGFADEVITQVRTKKTYKFVAKDQVVKNLIDNIRQGFTNGDLTDEKMVCLAALLNHGGFIRDYFNKVEVDVIRKRLGEFQKSETGSRVKNIMDIYADCAIVIMGGGW
jgi:hypothetical protein